MTRTRFAPAPTGLLHLGHVVNAVHVWELGRRHGAEVWLRIEDHDRQRSRPEYERAILDDLDWLGFRPDRFTTDAFRAGPCPSRQSDRGASYARAAEGLAQRGLVYACTCSRQQIGEARAMGSPEERACPGGCAGRRLPLVEGVTWRVVLAPGHERFMDLLRGEQTQLVAAAGDVAIRDRRGNWTYTFAVSVDDRDQEIDLVVRGRDLLESTGTQIALGRLLGRTNPPIYAHHGLVLGSNGQKLSKSGGATGIRALRDAGWPPSRVIGEAVRREEDRT
jgi:glutamyl-tRNA synthetase/glutamyl-Q tRNA(Asp) synthetase